MKKALVVIKFPFGKGNDDELAVYNQFLMQAKEQSGKSKDIEKLDENVWLIDVHTSQRFLAWLLATASSPPVSRPVRVMYLEHEEWISL